MKKILTFLTAGALIMSVCFLVYACRKQTNTTDIQSQVPDNLLKAAQDFEAAHTQTISTTNNSGQTNAQSGQRVLSIQKSHVLQPNWSNAKLQKLTNGETQIVVASPEYPLDPKSRWSAVRKFIYNVKDNQIVSGKIIEMFGKPGFMSTHKDNVIENYTDGKIDGFTGSVITYDLNYLYLIGTVYNQGTKLRALARIGQDNGQHRKASSNNVFSTVQNDGLCYDVYDIYTLYDSSGNTIGEEWDYMYSYCDPSEGSDGYGSVGDPGGATVDNCSQAEAAALQEAEGEPDGSDAGAPVYTQIDDHHRTRDMPWNAVKGVWGPWVYFSEETGYEYSAIGESNVGQTPSYLYTSIAHVQDHFTGTPRAGSITFGLNRAYGSVSGDGTQATMSLDYTEVTSVTCVINIEVQRISGTASKTWTTR